MKPNVKPHWWLVKILPEEFRELNYKASLRNQNGKQLNFHSRTKDASNKWDLSGVSAEFAAAMIYNLKENVTVSNSLEKLRSGDLLNKGGKHEQIEVRASTGELESQWDLMLTENKSYPDRIYIHAITAWLPEWVVITGWEWGHTVLASTKVRRSQYNENNLRCIHAFDLRTPDSLFDVLRERKGIWE